MEARSRTTFSSTPGRVEKAESAMVQGPGRQANRDLPARRRDSVALTLSSRSRSRVAVRGEAIVVGVVER